VSARYSGAIRDQMTQINTALFTELYELLRNRFRFRNWWPGETAFEVCVGAVLTQNTSWKNVEKAGHNLKSGQNLDSVKIYEMSQDALAELIRPAGYFNVKAGRLKAFVNFLMESYNGDLDLLLSRDIYQLRSELLAVHGIGPETADSIILYAAEKPIFVIDAYTRRVLERHGIISGDETYGAIQDLFHKYLPRDVALYNDFHAQFVAVGHHYCKKKPLCENCPLCGFHEHTCRSAGVIAIRGQGSDAAKAGR
jgi:endonuclease III related protein